MRRPVAALLAMIPVMLAGAHVVAACEPYTFGDDEWNLERGVQWAFLGTVIRDVPNADLPLRPSAMIVAVERSIVGRPAVTDLRIAQSDSCDGFWYGPGDRVVVALPAYDHWHEPPRPLPSPAEYLQNDTVAVWVLDGERVLQHAGRSPMIDGRRLLTLDDLLVALVRLPDTATARQLTGPTTSPDPFPAILAGAAAAVLTLRRLERPPRARPATLIRGR